jgi:uncharacterized membrane protein
MLLDAKKTARKNPARQYYLLILVSIAIGTFLRFFLLTQNSLWLDEGASLDYSDGGSVREVIAKIINSDAGDRFQPLYYVVLYYWRSIFGSSEFAVRSLSAILGIGTVITLSATAWQLYGVKHAFWTTLFLSLSSYGVYYSQQTRAYTLLLFLAALQLYFFSQTLQQKSSRNQTISQILFCLTTAIGLFCSIFIGIYTLALCIAHLIVYKNVKRWFRWWLPVAISCLPAALFYLASPVATDPSKVHVTPAKQPLVQNTIFVLYGLLVGETYGPPIEQLRGGDRWQVILSYLPLLLLLLSVVGIVFIGFIVGWRLRSPEARKDRPIDRFFLYTFATSFVVAVVFAIVTRYNWLPRHSFYIYIPLAFLLPIALRKPVVRQSLPWSRIYHFAFVALLLLNIYSTFNYYFEPKYQREDYREIAQYLKANNSENVRSVILYGASNLLSYYGDSETIHGLGLDTDRLAAEVSKVTNNSPKVLIAIEYQSFWEQKNNFDLESSMAKSYDLESHVSFINFDVYHYVRR